MLTPVSLCLNTGVLDMLKKKLTVEERFWAKVARGPEDQCWEWLAARAGPYRRYGSFCGGKNNKTLTAHRFSYILHSGEVPHGLDVMHKCDNGLCVNPSHLEVGTRKKNMEDAKARGRLRPYDRRGEKNSNTKLSKEEVDQIRKYIDEGYTQQSIAAEFGVHQTLISRIKIGRSWNS